MRISPVPQMFKTTMAASVSPATLHSAVLTEWCILCEQHAQAGDARRPSDHKNHKARNFWRKYPAQAIENRRQHRFEQTCEDRHSENKRQASGARRQQAGGK